MVRVSEMDRKSSFLAPSLFVFFFVFFIFVEVKQFYKWYDSSDTAHNDPK